MLSSLNSLLLCLWRMMGFYAYLSIFNTSGLWKHSLHKSWLKTEIDAARVKSHGYIKWFGSWRRICFSRANHHGNECFALIGRQSARAYADVNVKRMEAECKFSVKLHNFSARLTDTDVFFQVMQLSESFHLWVGTNRCLGSTAVALNSPYVRE